MAELDATISAPAVLQLLRGGSEGRAVILFDVRERELYDKGRLEGAIHLTESSWAENTSMVPREATIVVYCESGIDAPDRVRALRAQGFLGALAVNGGLDALVEALDESSRAPKASPLFSQGTDSVTDFSGPFLVGDLVFSRVEVVNDGGVPDLPPDALLAPRGGRGVIVRGGYLEARPEQRLYVVRFEGPHGTLGPPVGCLPEELTHDREEAISERP